MGEPVPEKLDIFRINIYSAFLAKHAWRSNMLSVACFHGLRKEGLGLYGLPFWRTHTKKKKEKKRLHFFRSITTVCLKVLGRDMGYFSFKTSLRVVVDLE